MKKFIILNSYDNDMDSGSNELIENGYEFVGSEKSGTYHYVMFFQYRGENV